MEPSNPQPPTEITKFLVKLPLYVRIGFGLIVVFGMVGNCAGKREGSLLVFIMVTILWACSRMLQEAFQSLELLRHLKQWEDELKKQPPASRDDEEK